MYSEGLQYDADEKSSAKLLSATSLAKATFLMYLYPTTKEKSCNGYNYNYAMLNMIYNAASITTLRVFGISSLLPPSGFLQFRTI
jgi:hypothetical protein